MDLFDCLNLFNIVLILYCCLKKAKSLKWHCKNVAIKMENQPAFPTLLHKVSFWRVELSFYKAVLDIKIRSCPLTHCRPISLDLLLFSHGCKTLKSFCITINGTDLEMHVSRGPEVRCYHLLAQWILPPRSHLEMLLKSCFTLMVDDNWVCSFQGHLESSWKDTTVLFHHCYNALMYYFVLMCRFKI